jgi:hypothetical protein
MNRVISPSGIVGLIERAFWSGDAEAPASSVASASCYRGSENVRVLPVIEAPRKLVQVQRQVLLADVVVRPDDAALQQAPEGFKIVRVDVAAHILAARVVHGRMRQAHVLVADVFIGRDKRNLVTNHVTHEAARPPAKAKRAHTRGFRSILWNTR